MALSLVSSCGLAQSKTQIKSRLKAEDLFFPAQRNQVQVLPQRFEFQRLAEDRLKIGNILLDSSQIRFDFLSRGSDKHLVFFWPWGLLADGELSLLDQTGISLWSTKISSRELQKKEPSGDQKGGEALALFTSPPLDSALVESLKYKAFVRFCLVRSRAETYLRLCSAELYVSSAGSALEVKQRQRKKPQGSIVINGNSVGNQGVLSLNDSSQLMFFQAEMGPGSFLEVETRAKAVDFFDVVKNTSPPEGVETLRLSGRGAMPAQEEGVDVFEDGSWSVVLPTDRPLLYLQGEGGIPLRQEFYVRGPLPEESYRPRLKFHKLGTYSSNLEREGLKSSKARVGTASKQNLLIEKNPKEFKWQVRTPAHGRQQRYFLGVIPADRPQPRPVWYAGQDFKKARPGRVELETRASLPWARGGIQARAQWWLEDVFGLGTHQWGSELAYEFPATQKANSFKLSSMALSVFWKWRPSLEGEEDTEALKFSYNRLTASSESLSGFGLGYFKAFDNNFLWIERFPKSRIELESLLPASSSQLKLGLSFFAKYRLEAPWRFLGPKGSWYIGGGLAQWSLRSSLESSPSNPGFNVEVQAGISSLF